MKIAFCIFKYFPYGGLQRDFLSIASECHNRGHEIIVYTISWEGDLPKDFDIKLVPVNSMTNYGLAKKYSDWIQKEIKTIKFDCVVGFNRVSGLDLYFAGDNCYLLKGYRERSFLYRFTPRFWMFSYLEKSIFNPCAKAHILILTERQMFDYRKCYFTQDERFHLLPPGISPERRMPSDYQRIRIETRNAMDIQHDATVVLQVGSGFLTKGVIRSLKAVASLPQNMRDHLIFLVAGQDNLAQYILIAQKLGIENNVKFLGGRGNILNLMLASDILLHPAVDEATGTVLIEAIAVGLPIICTEICGYSQIVKKVQSGIIIPEPFSQQSLNSVFFKMLFNNESLGIMRTRALEYSHKADIFSRFKQACDIIEKIPTYASESYSTQFFSKNEKVYLRKEFRDAWRGKNVFDEVDKLHGKVFRLIKNRRTLQFF